MEFLYFGRKTSNNYAVKNRQTSSQAGVLVNLLECYDFDDVRRIEVFADT